MNRLIKFAIPALALGVFAVVPSVVVKGDDAPPATQPAKGATGVVSFKVVDGDGKVVSGATVDLNTPPAAGAPAAPRQRGAARPKPIAEGTTDDKGMVTLKDVPVGDYSVMARTQGANGRGKVTVAADAPADAAPTTITIKPRAARGGGAGGAPPAGGGNGN